MYVLDFFLLQIAVAIKVDLPEQTQLQTCHRYAPGLHVLVPQCALFCMLRLFLLRQQPQFL